MLLIYLPVVSSRSEYIFKVIFKHELGIEYSTTADITIFENYPEAKINYSGHRHKDEFFIKAYSLLSENFVANNDIIIEEKDQTKVLFPNDESCNMGFDIFAAIFYMLSRYEEYLPFTPDEHGRYNASDSLAYKNNFLHIPLVDVWMERFKLALQKRFPTLEIKTSNFKAIITYDIDVAYKFKGRNIKRNIGTTIKDFSK